MSGKGLRNRAIMFADFCHMVSEGVGDLLSKVLLWFDVNGLFTVFLYLAATWEVQQPGP